MTNSKNLGVCIDILLLFLFAPLWARGQAATETKKVDFCRVVASPTDYDRQTLSVEVILWPSEHSLSLYGAACVPKEGYNVTTQAALPEKWESSPNGKKLSEILKRHRSAKVEVVGIFESNGGPYGPDVARFRFSISQIKSASENKARKGG